MVVGTHCPSVSSRSNFGRIKDPVIDQALGDEPRRDRPGEEEGARRDGQPGVRDQCYNIWGDYDLWGLPHTPDVQGIEDFTLPSGDKACLCNGIAGVFNIQSVWIKQ